MGRGIDVHVVDHDEQTSVVQVHGARQTVELFVRTTGQLSPDLTMWVPLLVPMAMQQRLPLRIHGPVDQAAMDGAARAQELLASWWPKWLETVPVEADDAVTVTEPSTGVGLAFSAGVDAFHSLHRHLDQVSHLWFVHGFDVPLWRTDLRSSISDHLAQVADVTGKDLVEVVTNVKPWADRQVRWGEVYHGAATAGIAIGHAPTWGRALIASGHVKADLHPWGSHPELDQAWSSDTVQVVHDAVEYDRVEKVQEVAGWDVAMDHLRVCWLNPHQRYNCGTCDKCVRTKINLLIAGGTSQSLPGDVTADMIGPIHPGESVYHGLTNLRHLRAASLRPDLQVAIEKGLREGPAARRRAKMKDRLRQVLASTKRLSRRDGHSARLRS